MPRFLKFLALIAVAALPVGCDAPRFDASSDLAMNQSLERLKNSLDEPGKVRFQADILTLMEIPQVRQSKGNDPSRVPGGAPSLTVVLKPLQGLTAIEIHERAEAVRAAGSSANGK